MVDITNIVLTLDDGTFVELERFSENGEEYVEVINSDSGEQLCVFNYDDSIETASEDELVKLIEYYL